MFAKLIINFLVILIGSHLMPRVSVDSIWTAAITAVVISLLNSLVKPIFQFFAFPITILTLGLFLLVINAIMILIADYLVQGFHVDGFMPALIFSIILSFVTWLFDRDTKKKKD